MEFDVVAEIEKLSKRLDDIEAFLAGRIEPYAEPDKCDHGITMTGPNSTTCVRCGTVING